MIRPFHLRDMALVHRLGERGVILQAEAALTTVPHPTRRALVNKLLGGQYSTYVWKSNGRDSVGFIQLSWEDTQPSAHLIVLAVEGADDSDLDPGLINEDLWLALLDEVVVEAGGQGVHSLIAEAAEDGPELPVLRQAGFAIYTRQDIWIGDYPADVGEEGLLQPQQALDEWDIQVLYANIVPGLIQSVEPYPPLNHGKNWVLREDGELAAFVHIRSGPVANWLRLLIHPNAQTKPNKIIKAALLAGHSEDKPPIYCCVPRYQSWLQGALEKAGFRRWGSHAVMVKQMVQPIEKSAPNLQEAWDSQAVPSSSSLVQGFSRQNGGNQGKG